VGKGITFGASKKEHLQREGDLRQKGLLGAEPEPYISSKWLGGGVKKIVQKTQIATNIR